MTAGTEAVLADVCANLLPHLDERQKRLTAGAIARLLGHGGIRIKARAARMAGSLSPEAGLASAL
ncbi:hypothetical protein GCM10022205_18220 [Spinactinospora alkalitolerans]